MPILRSSLMAATGAAALAACASAAQQRIEPSPNAGLQTGQDHDITVRQIPQETGSPSQRNSVEQLDQGETPRAEVSQLPGDAEIRSEEHTSALQSLMRISYAVFCLKKKT